LNEVRIEGVNRRKARGTKDGHRKKERVGAKSLGRGT